MNRFVITELEGRTVTAGYENGRLMALIPEENDGEGKIGEIFVGRVQNVLKNINAAFVEYLPGKIGYLSFREAHGRPMRNGACFPVQIAKEAVKTKDPVLTCELSFPGRYCVVTVGDGEIGVSHRIRSDAERNRLKEIAGTLLDGEYGAIIRTAAEAVPEEELTEELRNLRMAAEETVRKAGMRTPFTRLREGDPEYIRQLRDTASFLEEVVTDLPEVRDRITEHFRQEAPDELGKLRFYDDPMIPLVKLRGLEKELDGALRSLVWMKSGANLVIERTEALTVIDVNTGKFITGKKMRDAVRKINLEAAEEAARQMSLRNLTGMILIDFINMKEKEDTEEVLSCLRNAVSKDHVRTVVVDMTALGLVEVTRQKQRRPIAEVFRRAKCAVAPQE